jgi:hypothetical protein
MHWRDARAQRTTRIREVTFPERSVNLRTAALPVGLGITSVLTAWVVLQTVVLAVVLGRSGLTHAQSAGLTAVALALGAAAGRPSPAAVAMPVAGAVAGSIGGAMVGARPATRTYERRWRS